MFRSWGKIQMKSHQSKIGEQIQLYFSLFSMTPDREILGELFNKFINANI